MIVVNGVREALVDRAVEEVPASLSKTKKALGGLALALALVIVRAFKPKTPPGGES